jgi:membrane fusion protein (multidrug efflux system)
MKLHLSRKSFYRWALIGLAIISLLYLASRYLGAHPSTDDAYVQANTINMAAQVTGPVEAIYVQDHQKVAAGQLLFTIDPRPFQIAVERSTATVAAQQSALVLAEQNAKRLLRLVAMGQESKATGDQAQSQLDSAKAGLLASQAQLDQAQLDLAHTKIFAPQSGVVTQFTIRPGNNVLADNTLFMLVEQNNFWVDANFKETQVARIKAGQKVKIVLDMFPHHSFEGIVDAVSSASGSVFSLMPPENASGNWVKVTQRFPVKILIKNPDTSFPLRAGATATATIDTSERVG